jgi:hypothetical protein
MTLFESSNAFGVGTPAASLLWIGVLGCLLGALTTIIGSTGGFADSFNAIFYNRVRVAAIVELLAPVAQSTGTAHDASAPQVADSDAPDAPGTLTTGHYVYTGDDNTSMNTSAAGG